MAKYILVMDQGTTGSRGIVYNEQGKSIAIDYEEYEQFFPQSGWWEQNGMTVWDVTLRTARNAIRKAGLEGKDITAIGITNQRETTTLWDKNTGIPVHNSIVWGCRRTTDIVNRLRSEGCADIFNERTGLVLDPTYSGTKIRWVLENVPAAMEKASNGDLLFGTIDTWLLWNLTKGKVHATDYSNAARTLVFNPYTLEWDDVLLDLLDLPHTLFPKVQNSVGTFGVTDPEWFGAEIPITGIAGDQSAALFGQVCFEEGTAKNTYGTSAVPLMFTGDKAPRTKTGLMTVAWGIDGDVKYSMGASILIAGQVVQWLRDKMNIVENAADTEAMAASLDDNGGLFFVPAFTGLGAPHYNMDARGMIIGVTAATTKEQMARAALESMAYQTRDLLEDMAANSGVELKELKVDGGASQNDWLMQFQADILNCNVIRPKDIETTALGACYLAGLGCGIWKSQEELKGLWEADRVFTPQMDAETREALYSQWLKAVEKSKDWLS
ncbi:MAG: glycerol kinase GlpK [Eubacterium aggregans]|uniref:Glycerol kinase n=1 Tax=Eubacterium aggregans TaxID=81409 RepID=A0A1H4C0B6_9FIRM|nr:glycerol kinase GlpK [Eubacterium aggregans]MDD4691681.1 glycerol kinase GlpK [Eubacterium aggregans]MEA5072849.1 glycerol kinase GlpK [Eubacterium aggregans]SEA53816.1 glycerol kinase [Eubacterium aggregans]